MTADSVLIKACLNGTRPPGSHPALPITPDEVAAAARAAMEAGAGAVHFHVRDTDGKESLDPDDVARTLEAVRAACPGLPLGVSTGAWILRDTARRFELVKMWRVLPDFASVNWSEEGAAELADLLLDMRVGVEAGLFTPADAHAFSSSPLAARCLRALIEVRERDGVDSLTLAAEMDAILQSTGPTIPRLHHGFADDTWRVIERALAIGRDVRIGLEDTLTLRDGRQAADNAGLVAAVVSMAAREGRVPQRLPSGQAG